MSDAEAQSIDAVDMQERFVLQERKLIWLSLGLSVGYIVLYWGHRLPGVRLLADLISSLQGLWLQHTSAGAWLIRGFFLFPCVLFVILLVRQIIPLRRPDPINALLLLANLLCALHAWSCVDILTR